MVQDPLDQIKAAFFVECEELLEVLLDGLADLEGGSGGEDTVNAIFRAVHSIKGGAGAFGLEGLVRFAHGFETALDQLRKGACGTTPETIRCFFRAADLLGDLVRAGRDGGPGAPDAESAALAALVALCGGDDPVPFAGVEDLGFAAMPLQIGDLPDDLAAGVAPDGPRCLRLKASPALFDLGHDPVHLLDQLRQITAVTVTCDPNAVPPLQDLDPHDCALRFDITLADAVPQTALDPIFEFAEGLCQVTWSGDLAPHPAPQALPDRAQGPMAALPTAATKPNAAPTVRVDLDRIDRLVNLVGELVINQAMLTENLRDIGVPRESPIAKGLDEFMQLTRDIQDSVMMIRAQPVKGLFQRMNRILREVSATSGKAARLVTEGEATEVDKTVLERLTEPLTHMIRNAVDHGLEPPETRRARGKPPEGQVCLSACHRSGRVLIEIRDDGEGLDLEAILARARAQGLVAPDVLPPEAEIQALLFQPGFSTARAVSDLSGRGVGMDVVKRAVEGLGGRISIQSRAGQGTRFTLSLPLTLAVMDGMVIRVCGQSLVMPLAPIVETISLAPSDIRALEPGRPVVQVRGEVLPLVALGAAMGFAPCDRPDQGSVALLIQAEGNLRYVLQVDAIEEQRQVVIKGLHDTCTTAPGIAAATILGDGQVSLILDPIELAALPAPIFPQRLEVA